MAVPPVADCLHAISGLGLVDAHQQKEIKEVLSVKLPSTTDLLKELCKRGWLTPYQSKLLGQGKADELSVGPYTILEKLGQGATGEVFKARHKSLRRLVALKVVRRDRLEIPDLVERFQRESAAAASMSHPNVVTIYDAGSGMMADEMVPTEVHYIAMELCEGVNLGQLMERGGTLLPINQACEYIRQTAEGLQHAHEHGLVHRDIKPDNLFITGQGTHVKILDFGLVRGDEFSPLTQTGSYLGTPDYLAPEQWQNAREVDIRADIYSLGCTLYQMLTGCIPFTGRNMPEKMLAHLTKDPPRIEERRPDLPRGLADVVRKMMAKDPKARYSTPAEVAYAMTPYIARANRPPSEPTLKAEEPAPSTRRRLPAPPKIETRPSSPAIRSRRRHPGLAWLFLLGGMVMLLPLMLLAGSLLGARFGIREKMENGRYAEAMEQISDWSAWLPTGAEMKDRIRMAWSERLANYVKEGKTAEAADEARQFLDWWPEDGAALTTLRQAMRQELEQRLTPLLQKGSFADANRLLRRERFTDPRVRDVVQPFTERLLAGWRDKAKREFQDGKSLEALATCDAILAAFPGDAKTKALREKRG